MIPSTDGNVVALSCQRWPIPRPSQVLTPMAMNGKKNMKKFEINYECADAITLANLKQARDYHKSELKKLKKDPTYWIHADDQVMYRKLIEAMDYLIKNYYGN